MTHFSTRKVALKTLQATMMVAALLLSATSAFAQRIQVLDTDGQPVPFVSVTDARGHYIGSTDLDGWLDDTKGNTTLNLSQVAYKPKTVDVSLLTDGKIILEDAALNLPEVVVKPKGLIYVQTYFRVVYIDEDGPIYYRGGLIDNSYDIEKKKVSAKNHHMSKGESGFIRFLLDRFAGQFDDFCKLPDRSHYQVMLRHQEKGNLTFSDTVNGRQIVSDSICPLGFVDWDKENGLRSASFSWRKFFAHKEAAEKLAKAQEKGKEVAPKGHRDRHTGQRHFLRGLSHQCAGRGTRRGLRHGTTHTRGHTQALRHTLRHPGADLCRGVLLRRQERTETTAQGQQNRHELRRTRPL